MVPENLLRRVPEILLLREGRSVQDAVGQLEDRPLASWLSGWLDDHDLSRCDGPFWNEARKRA